MTAAIEAKKLTIVRGGKPVLRDISCTVTAGRITGLIGPSGSGKTTLMRAIVGVQQIHEGALQVLGKSAGDVDLRRRIGYVTQSPAVYGDLTVEQNLRYFTSIVAADAKNVSAVIDAVRLPSQRKQLVNNLSGGQRARVSLAIALLGNPELLVLDEPTVGLDPILRDELWTMFDELAARGKTLLISSHVMDEAERCSERILMREGEVIWNDTKAALLKTTHTNSVGPAFVAHIKEGAA